MAGMNVIGNSAADDNRDYIKNTLLNLRDNKKKWGVIALSKDELRIEAAKAHLYCTS